MSRARGTARLPPLQGGEETPGRAGPPAPGMALPYWPARVGLAFSAAQLSTKAARTVSQLASVWSAA